ncbi:MAG: FAD-binding protein [Sedimentibacter sp.]|uniref:FAD-binding protein n=1 Tax=Sedimentibacter sp. TaxID=1960295 RepID=UPI003159701E
MKRFFSMLLITSLLLSSTACQSKSVDSSESKITQLRDGVYVESVYGNNYTLPFEVSVTIANNAISAIEVTNVGGEWSEYNDAIIQSAISTFIPRIIESQSIAVDATTGATMSCAGIRNAVSMAIKEAGGDSSDFSKKIEKSTETIVIDGYDVIVVGLGVSGVAAYSSAAQSGAKVFGLDSAARVGGTSSLVTGPMAVNPDSTMVQNGIDVDEKHFAETWKNDTDHKAKDDMIDLIVDKSGDAIDWTINSLGFEFYPTTSFSYEEFPVWAIYNTENKSISEMFIGAMEQSKTLNSQNDYQLELKAESILTDKNGMVSGVKAISYDGTTYEIHAPSVILCTGGFGGNREMTKEQFGYPISLHGMYQNDGIMIEDAIDNLQADTFAMDSAGMCHSGRVANPIRLDNIVPSHNKVLSAISNKADVLAVNENGTRFTNEEAGLTLAEYYWKGGTEYYYVIVSESYLQNIKENGLDSVYMMVNSQDFTNTEWYPSVNSDPSYELSPNDPITDMDELIKGSIDANNLYKADSIEALAEKLKMPELVASFTKYNEDCDNGIDTEFGKDSSLLKHIDDSEAVYAIKAKPYCYTTNGALNVNTDIEVLDTSGNVISGLYSCGTNSMGVFFTKDTGYIDYGGVAHGWAITSGMLAGENAATYANSKN